MHAAHTMYNTYNTQTCMPTTGAHLQYICNPILRSLIT